jgi:hypothetical protein
MVLKQSTILSSKFNLYTSLTIFHQNIRGLKQKIDELLCMLTSINLNPHIICLSEHYRIFSNLIRTFFTVLEG